jgi:hypothetical protein
VSVLRMTRKRFTSDSRARRGDLSARVLRRAAGARDTRGLEHRVGGEGRQYAHRFGA